MSVNAFDIAASTLAQKVRTTSDPDTADALQLIIDEIKRIGVIVDPAPAVQSKADAIPTEPPPNVSVFTATTNSRNVILEWTAPSSETLFYEVRVGAVWETASRVTLTANTSAILDPIAVGATTYLVKAINGSGVYSLAAYSVVLTIPAIGLTRLTPSVLTNNVLLYWTIPTSTFDIEYYIIKKGGTEFARIRSTFLAFTELVGGTYVYSVTPVDIAGNIGPLVSATVLVNDPPDFVLQSTITSTFAGTKTHAIVEDNNRLLVCIYSGESWQDHFINDGH